MKKILIFLLMFTIMFTVISCKPKENFNESLYTKSGFLLDTYIEINIYSDNESMAFKALEDAFEEIRIIENLMSVHLEDSEVSQINANAGVEGIEVDDRTLAVIKRGKYFGDITGGLFDITIGSLTKIWSITATDPTIPSHQEIARQLKNVDYNQIQIEGNKVKLNYSNGYIDLGGIAKGYAADRTALILRKAGITRGLVNLGGDIVAIGARNEERDWKIGIQHPREAMNVLIATVDIADSTVVSSGDYERFFIQDGVRYHHIFNPKTGYPAETDLVSVTIIADSAMDGDGFSTALFVMNSQKAIDFIESFDGLEGVLITDDLQIIISSGLQNRVNFE